jgi:hypothetical protein
MVDKVGTCKCGDILVQEAEAQPGYDEGVAVGYDCVCDIKENKLSEVHLFRKK